MSPRRWDLAVKVRFFRHLIKGNDPDAERVYRWHIEARSGHRMKAGVPTDKWKRSADDYVDFASILLLSMKSRGFHPGGVIPVDQDGELLDGSHRVACAIALGVSQIPYVVLREKKAWAEAWGEAWFVAKGMGDEDLERLRRDYAALTYA